MAKKYSSFIKELEAECGFPADLINTTLNRIYYKFSEFAPEHELKEELETYTGDTRCVNCIDTLRDRGYLENRNDRISMNTELTDSFEECYLKIS